MAIAGCPSAATAATVVAMTVPFENQKAILELVKPALQTIEDLTAREIAILAPLVVITIALGVYPNVVTDVTTPAVAKLDRGHCAMLPQKIVDAAVIGEMLAVVNARAVIRLFAAKFDGGFFAKNQPRAAHGELPQMHQVIIVGAAVALGRVLAHRRHHHAIAQRNRAERHRGKQQGQFFILGVVHKYLFLKRIYFKPNERLRVSYFPAKR